jgi:hypothetical protein
LSASASHSVLAPWTSSLSIYAAVSVDICAISHGSELACWLEPGGVSVPQLVLFCIVAAAALE